MAHRCYISFKTEDSAYKKHIQENLDIDMVDCSLDAAIDSDNEDYIMQTIRNQYLSDSTVTIHLIGTYGAEIRGWEEQRFIKRELQASLYHGAGNTQNGILGIVLPSMSNAVYRGQQSCWKCGSTHNIVNINDTTVVKEFSYNYYIPNAKCSWSEDDRYCVLTTWENFIARPEEYIDKAFEKRCQEIAEKTKAYPR